MIRFFRNIRLKLATENKIAAYLRYAIGEILLVVIGILIALHVNNWNEQRKDRMTEIQLLTDIRKSLDMDIENQINPNLAQAIKDSSNVAEIIQAIQNKGPFNDSLAVKYRSLMFSKSFSWEVSAYKELEADGIKLIENQELKNSVLKIYNMDYPEIKNTIGNFNNNLHEFYRPQMRNNFIFHYSNPENTLFIPVDYKKLLKNYVFMNSLLTAKINFQNLLNSLRKLKVQVNNLIVSLDDELRIKKE